MSRKTAMQEVGTRLERSGVQASAGFLDLVLPFLIGFLQKCLESRLNPTPQPAESKASPANWKKADEAQAYAERHYDEARATYDRNVLNRGATALIREHRKDGDRIKRDEAVAIVAANLDQARVGDLETNALDLDRTAT